MPVCAEVVVTHPYVLIVPLKLCLSPVVVVSETLGVTTSATVLITATNN